LRDLIQAELALAQQLFGECQAPGEEILHGWQAHRAAEACKECRAGMLRLEIVFCYGMLRCATETV
jgi:hypothetical protein